MAKHPVPKKQQPNSLSSRRFKSYQNKKRKKLMGMVDRMMKISKRKAAAKPAATPAKKSKKVTKIKA